MATEWNNIALPNATKLAAYFSGFGFGAKMWWY